MSEPLGSMLDAVQVIAPAAEPQNALVTPIVSRLTETKKNSGGNTRVPLTFGARDGPRLSSRNVHGRPLPANIGSKEPDSSVIDTAISAPVACTVTATL